MKFHVPGLGSGFLDTMSKCQVTKEKMGNFKLHPNKKYLFFKGHPKKSQKTYIFHIYPKEKNILILN